MVGSIDSGGYWTYTSTGILVYCIYRVTLAIGTNCAHAPIGHATWNFCQYLLHWTIRGCRLWENDFPRTFQPFTNHNWSREPLVPKFNLIRACILNIYIPVYYALGMYYYIYTVIYWYSDRIYTEYIYILVYTVLVYTEYLY